MIPRPLHNSATRRLTTLPIELINDQRDMSVAGHKNAEIPFLEKKLRKKTHYIAETVQHKLNYTSRLMSVNTCAGTSLSSLYRSKKNTRQNKKKITKKTEMLRATCSADFHRCRPDSNNNKDTRVFAGSKRATYRDQKNVCSRQTKTASHVSRSIHTNQTRE